MMSIVGIVLVKNEDLFVGRAVANVKDFCDRLILCDNGSTDGTSEILRTFAANHPAAEYHRMSNPRESHDLIKPFAGTPTWVFGVDGDEIYDPAKLALFRKKIIGGEYNGNWRMKGHALHCTALDAGHAAGHLSPPCRSITKLYNFSALKSWDGDTFERLHGGDIVFQEGWNDDMKTNLQDSQSWDECELRCLHTCFLRRSSRDPERPVIRPNIVEMRNAGVTGFIKNLFRGLGPAPGDSSWKNDHYRRGPVVQVDAGPFFPK